MWSEVAVSGIHVVVVFAAVVVVHPLHFSAVFPDATAPLSLLVNIGALTILLSCSPPSNIAATVCPNERAITLPLVVNEITLILLAILPRQDSLSMHFVLLPLAFIGFPVGPEVTPVTGDFILSELTLVE